MVEYSKISGYTVIELMIALIVSTIVIAGSLVGFNVIEKQFNEVNLKTSLDRKAVNFIKELQSDVSMAGYMEFQGATSMSAAEAIQFESAPFDDGANPSQKVQDEFRVTYDAKNESDVTYRKNVRYSCTKPAGSDLYSCKKTVRSCIASPCTGQHNVGVNVNEVASSLKEQASIEQVKEFSITRDNIKNLPGTVYHGAPQVLRIKLVLADTDKSKGVSEAIEKIYHFSIRARNVSMVKNYED